MPPVMGTVAFMMMSLTGFTYWNICIAAAIPAALFYLGAGWSIFLYAGKEKIAYTREEVDTRLLLRRAPLFIVPFTLIVVLLAFQYPPMYAAGWATIVGLALGCISKETRPSLSTLIEAFTRGAQTASGIATLLILVNLAFISVMSLTALGPTICGVIDDLSGGYLFTTLIFAMMASLLLGCLSPVAGAYIMVALMVTPLLERMGLSVMQAHFFALYFSVIGFMTPPAAPSALIASGIAGSSFIKTALEALRILGSSFLLPFLFASNPALLAQFASGPLSGAVTIIAALLAVATFSILLFNYYLTKLSPSEIVMTLLSLTGSLIYFFSRGDIWQAAVGSATCFILLTLLQLLRGRAMKIEIGA